jgi:hypothetical protein
MVVDEQAAQRARDTLLVCTAQMLCQVLMAVGVVDLGLVDKVEDAVADLALATGSWAPPQGGGE